MNTALLVLTNMNHLAASSAEALWTPGADASVSAPQLLLLLSSINSLVFTAPLPSIRDSVTGCPSSVSGLLLSLGCGCNQGVVSGPLLSLSKQREKEALAGGFTRISIHLRKR